MVSRMSSLAFDALTLCFLFFAVLSNASDTPPGHPHARRDQLERRTFFTETPDNTNFDDHQATPFTEFRGCTADQKRDITQSWWDVVNLVRIPVATNFNDPPGELESRVFGFDVHEREGAGDFIHMIYANIMQLYTEKIYGKIRMSCVDIRQEHRTKQVTCQGAAHLGSTGGYAFSYSQKLEENTIVMCPVFFGPGQELLEPLLAEVRSRTEYQRDPHQMNGKTRTLLHEMTHLASISETSGAVVHDQPLRLESTQPDPVYGPRMVQIMGAHKIKNVRDRTQLNADSYAEYATWKYFEALFGTPHAVDVPREEQEAYEADEESPPAETDTLVCAPTDTNGPVLSRANAKADIDAWCDSLNLDYISQDDTRKEQVKPFGSATPGTSLTDLVYSANWVPDVQGEGCPERTRGTEPKHCKKAMYEVLDSCVGKDGMDDGSPRYSGSQQGDEQCIIWKIEIVDKGVQNRKRGQGPLVG